MRVQGDTTPRRCGKFGGRVYGKFWYYFCNFSVSLKLFQKTKVKDM